MTVSFERARTVKEAHEAHWLSLEGVAGVGVGRDPDGGARIVVSVAADSKELRRRIPSEVEGVPVHLQVTGPIRPL